jgi:hypothetical protein
VKATVIVDTRSRPGRRVVADLKPHTNIGGAGLSQAGSLSSFFLSVSDSLGLDRGDALVATLPAQAREWSLKESLATVGCRHPNRHFD